MAIAVSPPELQYHFLSALNSDDMKRAINYQLWQGLGLYCGDDARIGSRDRFSYSSWWSFVRPIMLCDAWYSFLYY